MKALIFKDMVVQIEANEFPVAKGLTWMDAPEGCKPGWLLVDGVLEAPQVTPLSAEEKVRIEMPSGEERLEALWDWATNNDNTKVLEVEAKIQAVYDKHNVPRG